MAKTPNIGDDFIAHLEMGVAVYEPIDAGADFIFVDFNPAAERTDQIARGDLLGKRLTEAFPGVEEFGLLDVLRRVWLTGVPESLPPTEYRDDRIHGWRVNRVYRLTSGYVVAVYEDVTEQMQAQAALQASEERYRAVFEQSPDPVVLIDPKDYRIIEFNDAACETLGYRREELEGLSIPDLEAVLDLEQIESKTAQVLQDTGAETFETIHRTRHGDLRAVEVRLRKLKSEDGRELILGIFHDLTKQKLGERLDALRQYLSDIGSLDAMKQTEADAYLADLKTEGRKLLAMLEQLDSKPPKPEETTLG